jgi:hypothetical protein
MAEIISALPFAIAITRENLGVSVAWIETLLAEVISSVVALFCEHDVRQATRASARRDVATLLGVIIGESSQIYSDTSA